MSVLAEIELESPYKDERPISLKFLGEKDKANVVVFAFGDSEHCTIATVSRELAYTLATALLDHIRPTDEEKNALRFFSDEELERSECSEC